jgi:hypothetical protein
MGYKTAVLNQTGNTKMARNQDNQVGGFIKAQKPVRQTQARSTKITHNRRAGFDSKRNQAGYTLLELLYTIFAIVLFCGACALVCFMVKYSIAAIAW